MEGCVDFKKGRRKYGREGKRRVIVTEKELIITKMRMESAGVRQCKFKMEGKRRQRGE